MQQIQVKKSTSLIYMQDTINYFYEIDEKMVNEVLVKYGMMEVKDIQKEELVRYYKFKI